MSRFQIAFILLIFVLTNKTFASEFNHSFGFGANAHWYKRYLIDLHDRVVQADFGKTIRYCLKYKLDSNKVIGLELNYNQLPINYFINESFSLKQERNSFFKANINSISIRGIYSFDILKSKRINLSLNTGIGLAYIIEDKKLKEIYYKKIYPFSENNIDSLNFIITPILNRKYVTLAKAGVLLQSTKLKKVHIFTELSFETAFRSTGIERVFYSTQRRGEKVYFNRISNTVFSITLGLFF